MNHCERLAELCFSHSRMNFPASVFLVFRRPLCGVLGNLQPVRGIPSMPSMRGGCHA